MVTVTLFLKVCLCVCVCEGAGTAMRYSAPAGWGVELTHKVKCSLTVKKERVSSSIINNNNNY